MASERNKSDSRKFIQRLKRNGYRYHRSGKGDHSIYIKDNKSISIPHRLNKMVVRRIVKELNLL